MVHHQSDMSPTLLEVLRQLQAKASETPRFRLGERTALPIQPNEITPVCYGVGVSRTTFETVPGHDANNQTASLS